MADPDAMFLCLALAHESSASISQRISFISKLRNVIRSDENLTCHLIASGSELTNHLLDEVDGVTRVDDEEERPPRRQICLPRWLVEAG